MLFPWAINEKSPEEWASVKQRWCNFTKEEIIIYYVPPNKRTLCFIESCQKIKPESDQDSVSSCQFVGNSEDERTCWTALWLCSQQGSGYGNLSRSDL